MTQQELYEIVRKEIDIRASTDPAFRYHQQQIAKGNGDFTDSSQCSRILSEILGEKLAKYILELPLNEGRSEVCQQLLKDHFDEVSRTFEQIQTAQDRAKGLDLGTVKPPFPAERVREVGHSLDDPTEPDETIQRRCRNAVTNVAHSMHDDFVKENAKFRNDLGLKPIIQRFGAGACAWCSAVSGKYRFGEQPADIFRRHDNCQCTIIYDTQVLRGVKTEGGGRSKTWEEVNPTEIEENGFNPTVLTQEQARQFEERQLNQITRLTPEQARNLSLTTGGNGGKIEQRKPFRISMQFFASSKKENKNISKSSDRELRKSIDSWRKRAEEHRGYIQNPYEHCPDWDTYDPRRQEGLKRHWQKEISNFERDIQEAQEELRKRGENNGNE